MSGISLEKILLLLDWTKKKVEVHSQERGEIIFHVGEIWWSSIGENIGSEISGKSPRYERPVIIVKKLSSNMMFVVPTTTKMRFGSWYYKFTFRDQDNCAVLAQLRAISSKRLIRRVGVIPPQDFAKLQQALLSLIKTETPALARASSGSFN